MSISRPFILRPIATSLLMTGLLLVGIVAYKQLPISALPQVDYPTIQVVTFYPGASPDVTASSITAPLERQFGELPGLSQMTSSSSFGASVITLQFNLEENIDVAEQEVQAAINSAQTYLPADLPTPPIYSKVNPADAPILTLAMTSDSMPLPQVEDLADTTFAQKISQLPGVGLVSISGGQKPAVRIMANPTALASYGMSLEQLRTVIAQVNVDQAKGQLQDNRQAFTIGANDQLLSPQGYADTIVAYKNGNPVRLSDVATVVTGAENVNQAAWMNTTPAVILNIQRQPGANIIKVVDSIKLRLKQLQSNLPASVKVTVLTDRTNTIRASVNDVQYEMMLTIVLVVLVIFVFLRTLSATDHPQHCGTALAGRHLRRDVPAGLLARQPVADGADDLHRLRGGRRHRHDREHRALHRGGALSAGSGAARRGTDRLHHRVADGFADRCADSVALHGRHRGPAVPRVRGNAERDHSFLGHHFADADADDVLSAAASQRAGEAWAAL